jgi:hypothetical protein
MNMARRKTTRKRRCHCHKPRHKRSKAILTCDIILGIMIAVLVFFILYLIVLPASGIDVDLTPLINEFYTGLWLVVFIIILNVGWAIYYGCHKSAAGIVLSTLTLIMMLYTYIVN